MNYSARQSQAVQLLTCLDLDALVLRQGENLRYLCGFTGSDGLLVVSAEEVVFLTDSRYTEQAGQQVVGARVEQYQAQAEGLHTCLSRLGVRKVGVEPTLACGTLEEWRDKVAGGMVWTLVKPELESLRLHKDSSEIAALVRAADLNHRVFTEVLPSIRPGVTEREIALALEFALKRLGAEEKAFDFIVASGPRGALPHGVASDRQIGCGELVTIDFGCRLSGYHSDETVTLAVGEPDPQLREIFDIVLEAHDRAMAAVRPGVALADIDRVARDYITAAGYGGCFGHGLGHGVGMAVHEAPVVSPRSKAIAAAGMVITIEPGIYLSGRGGVRIEDMVHVTADGAQPLTSIPKTFYNVLAEA